MERPKLDKNISADDFKDFYWLKRELVEFCKKHGINVTGGKIAISEKINRFLATGEIPPVVNQGTKSKSNFDWKRETLSPSTIITDNYGSTENVRAFFKKEIGPHFSLNVKFMEWMKQNAGRSLGDAVRKWNEIHKQKKDSNHQTEIAPQFEYNRYMRAFLADNPDLTLKDAMKFWKLKRSRRGANIYERRDPEIE